MYGFPRDLDLSIAIGQETTQFCIGPYDLQFSFGKLVFAVQSQVELRRDGVEVATWQGGEWPGPAFYEAFGSPVSAIRLVDEKRLCVALQNGLELHLLDNSGQYESLLIYVDGVEGPYVV